MILETNMQDEKHWRKNIDHIREVLNRDRTGLITDIDGTLSPIAPTPEAAEVLPAGREALEVLVDRIFVAAVSGRAAEDARRMVRIEGVIYVGNHGMERWTPAGLELAPGVADYVGKMSDLLRHAEATLEVAGVIVEDKGSTGSIHYRRCSDPEAAREAILDAIAEPADEAGLVITQGRQVIEIRPPLAYDKGAAVHSLIADYDLTGVFYPGDDTTDVDAFRAIQSWRSQTDGAGLALGVIDPETPDAVKEVADLHLAGVEDVVSFLDWLVRKTT